MEKKISWRKLSKNIASVVVNIVFVVALLFVGLLMYYRFSGKIPQFFGYSYVRIASESMKGTLEVGDVLLIKYVDPATLVAKDDDNEGDIITFIVQDKESAIYGLPNTHRIIEKVEEGKFRTQGDANAGPDEEIVESQNIVGKFIKKLTVFTFVMKIFSSNWGFIIIIGLIVAVFIAEFVQIVKIGLKNLEN